MDAALGRMAKRMRADKDNTVDLSNGGGENKPLKGNLTNTCTRDHTHIFEYLHAGARFGKAKVLAAALQPLANALSAHSVGLHVQVL